MLTFQSITMELLVLGLGFILLFVKLFTKKDAVLPYGWIATIGLAAIAIFSWFSRPDIAVTFGGMYYTDDYSFFFKELILVCAILVCLSSIAYVKKKGYREAEYYILLLFATLGMMVFTSAGDLITLYVGLELMTMSFIVLIGFARRNALSTEAAIKYLVLSGLSSAIMLYVLQQRLHGLWSFALPQWFCLQAQRCTIPHVGTRHLPRRTNTSSRVLGSRCQSGLPRSLVPPFVQLLPILRPKLAASHLGPRHAFHHLW